MIASRGEILSMDMNWEELPILQREVSRTNFLALGIVDRSGSVRSNDGTTTKIADRDYFQRDLKGGTQYF